MCAPVFAGYDAHALLAPLGSDPARLPPLVIAGVGHMQDIPVVEQQTAGGQAGVLGGVVVKQGSGREKFGVDILTYFGFQSIKE